MGKNINIICEHRIIEEIRCRHEIVGVRLEQSLLYLSENKSKEKKEKKRLATSDLC